jgi:phage repressor protein C with HTH and peptisase S24 domain
MTYSEQLRALLKKFTQTEIADLLGVTDRTLQFWVAEENPKIPFQKTQRKIHELYENLIVNRKSIDELNEVAEPVTPFHKRRSQQKTAPTVYMAPLIPVKAQAGYVRAIDQSTFIDTLEQYALPPGVKPQGAVWAYWEIEGSSMEPVFKSGDIILASQVPQMDWDQLRNFYIYVIVTDERVLFKRVYCKNALEWVLISENEEENPQQLLPVEYIKEVWVYRKTIKTDAAPTKTFEIKV